MRTVALGEICKVTTGQSAPQERSAFGTIGTPFVRAGSLERLCNGESEDSLELVSQDQARKYRLKIFPKDTVVFAKSGMSAKVGRVYKLRQDCHVVSHLAAILPSAEVDSSYLNHWFQYSPPSRLIDNEAYPSIKTSALERIEIPLPSLSEQRRIAAILDKAAVLRAKRREVVGKLDQLLQSVFLDMFGDSVTNPKEWPDQACLADMASICSGITKGRRTSEAVREVPYLAVANVQDRYLKLETIKTIEATQVEIDRYRLVANDLLLTEGGDPDKLGRGALWNASIPDCIHQNHVFRVRVTSDLVNPIYLNWLIGSARGKRYFLGVAKQTTGIASINMTQLKKFPLLIPPVERQNKFATIVSTMELQQQRQIKFRSTSDLFFQSLQQRAFAGTL